MPFQYTCESCGKGFSRASSPTSGRVNRFCSRRCYGDAAIRGPEDFWARVDRKGPNECWPWGGATTRGGYGHLKYQGSWIYAHRLAYKLTYGTFPSPQGRHSCDYRPCCNPAHLLAGTQQKNMDDMTERERQQRGERHYNARLMEADIRRIRSLHQEKVPLSAIALSYGCTRKNIQAIVYRKTWKHVT